MELVSIVMPVKNAAPYLEECLLSIQQQDYPHWELLAVNDGSSDDSVAILEAFAREDARIRLSHSPGTGIIPALRAAFQLSKGHYITRMDADDIMPAYKLSTMVNALQNEHPHTLVTGYVQYFSEQGVGPGFKNYEAWLNSLVDHNTHYREIYKECVIPSPCWMTTREAFLHAGAFDGDIYPEDYDLTFRFFVHDIAIKPIPTLLHLWRDHATRTSRTHIHYSVNSFLELKVHYFLQLDYDHTKQLVVWGAGKKGKRVAQLLQEHNIPFEWICNNPHKIGVAHYGVIWRDYVDFFHDHQSYQLLGLVSRPNDITFIKGYLQPKKNVIDHWFC